MNNYKLIILLTIGIMGSFYFYKMMYILNKKNIYMSSIFVIFDVPGKYKSFLSPFRKGVYIKGI